MELQKVDCEGAADIQVEQILHMNGGQGDYSYAKYGCKQKKVISKAKPLIEESIFELCSNNFPECLKIADLGCASGPNAYLPTWNVVEALQSTCLRLNRKPPMLQVFLNDLPGNDFNSTFKLLPSFYGRLKTEESDDYLQCFVSAVPGSFYRRLFPSNSLHFVVSSYALHWLSQVPRGLVNESGIVHISKTSPPNVHKAYLDQFDNDFTTFLKLRSQEMKPEGRMILALRSDDHNYPSFWEIFEIVVKDMVSEGLIEESKLVSFNVPLYGPSAEEIRCVIERQGSFNINKLETYHGHYQSPFVTSENDNKGFDIDKHAASKQMANRFRSIGESLVSNHFGNAILVDMFQRFSVKAIDYFEMGLGATAYLLVSLTKK